MKIEIDGKTIGDGYPCYTVAEVGSNFDGSLERAKKLIDLAKTCGADAVKFQSFKADKIVSKKGFENLKAGFQTNWKKPVYEVYEDAEFNRNWTKELLNYSKNKGITFFSAPYDKKAVDDLVDAGVSVFKIGSGDITWLEIIEYIAKQGKPIILGTGASTMTEIQNAVDVIHSTGNEQLVILQCVTNYPASFEQANIRAIELLRSKFNTLVGYSDHTPGYIVPMGTVALGGCMVEKHFTDDKNRLGPDHPFAMDGDDFKLMVDNIRTLEKALGKPEKELYPEESDSVILQRRCVRAKNKITADSIITKSVLEFLRPAPKGSFSPGQLDKIIGRKVKVDIEKGKALLPEHF